MRLGPTRRPDDQVPHTRLQHQAQRLHDVCCRRQSLPLIADLQQTVIPHRACGGQQVGFIAAAGVVEPARRVQVEAVSGPACAGSQLIGQRREQLELGGSQRRAQAELAGWPRQAGHEQRARLLRGQAGEPRAVAVEQPAAAAWAGLRRDGDSRLAERVKVPVDGAD